MLLGGGRTEPGWSVQPPQGESLPLCSLLSVRPLCRPIPLSLARRSLSFSGILVALLLACPTYPASPPVRRALLVGISQYDPDPKGPLNLKAPASDVEAIGSLLTLRFGFPAANIKTLTDAEATREAILQGIRKDLIEASGKGDVVLFYFSGHGSQLKAPGSDKAGGWAETIVPYDGRRSGGRDIRDKELRALFNDLVDKGVVLTAVFDCCHSGAITRGLPREGLRARMAPPLTIEPALRPEESPDLREPPEKRGAVVLAACLPRQVAYEKLFPQGDGLESHGALTWALLETLGSSPASVTAGEVYSRAKASVAAELPEQEPVLAGDSGRTFFGGPKGEPAPELRLASSSVTSEGVVFLAGSAVGLTKGTRLKEINPKHCRPVVLEIVRVNGPASCVAHYAPEWVTTRLSGAPCDPPDPPVAPGAPWPYWLPPGSLFEVSSWAAPSSSPLRVHLPDPAPAGFRPAEWGGMIRRVIEAAGMSWATDPTETPPSVVLEWQGQRWSLWAISGRRVEVGPMLSERALAKAIGGLKLTENGAAGAGERDAFFWAVPPPAALLGTLQTLEVKRKWTRLGIAAGAAVESQYRLVGVLDKEGECYAWVKSFPSGVSGEPSVLPERTDWIRPSADGAAASLESSAEGLASLLAWLQLSPPPSAPPAPFKLRVQEWVRDDTGERVKVVNGLVPEGHALVEGHQYGFCLEPQAPQDAWPAVAYAYVIGIDRTGKRTLLFPPMGTGNSENKVLGDEGAEGLGPSACVPLGTGPVLEIAPPFGNDLYMLLLVDEPIVDPSALNGEPIIRRGPADKPNSRLGQLLERSITRGEEIENPGNWSVYRAVYPSRPQ